MNLPDSFYIALCMTVLLVGAVYWVWTQIQYVQRKVNVLENIVYELKTLCSAHPPPPDLYNLTQPVVTNTAVVAPYEEDTDDLHQTLRAEIEAAQQQQQQQQQQEPQDQSQAPLESDTNLPIMNIEELIATPVVQETPDATTVQAAIDAAMEAVDAESELQPGGVGSGMVDTASALESMTLKELKRLAQQRGVVGYSEMKKREIITALRALPSDGFSEM